MHLRSKKTVELARAINQARSRQQLSTANTGPSNPASKLPKNMQKTKPMPNIALSRRLAIISPFLDFSLPPLPYTHNTLPNRATLLSVESLSVLIDIIIYLFQLLMSTYYIYIISLLYNSVHASCVLTDARNPSVWLKTITRDYNHHQHPEKSL